MRPRNNAMIIGGHFRDLASIHQTPLALCKRIEPCPTVILRDLWSKPKPLITSMVSLSGILYVLPLLSEVNDPTQPDIRNQIKFAVESTYLFPYGMGRTLCKLDKKIQGVESVESHSNTAATSRSPTSPNAAARLRMIHSPRMRRENRAANCAPIMAPIESAITRRNPC